MPGHTSKFRTLVETCLLLSVLLPLSGHSIEPEASVRAVEVLRTTSTWLGSPIELPHGPPEIIGVVIEIAPGGETGWHSHPAPSFAFVIAGTLEVRLASGAMKRFRSGEAFAEVIDTQHNGRSIGHDPVKLVVFYATTPGVPSLRLAIAEPVKMPPAGDRPLVSEQQLCTQVLKSEIFARTELLFGLARTGRPDITEQEFRQFVDTKVTPRFPDGLTLISGDGQFKDASGTIVEEGSKLLILLYPFSRHSSKQVDQIRRDYKELFQQESVLRIDDLSCVSF